jgi:glycosyltransferase involved in cell wall biosynthesis
MRILSITAVFPPLWNFGGTVITGIALARELSRQGHKVFTLATDARCQSEQQVPVSVDTVWEGVQVRYCKKYGPTPPFWSPELKRQVRLRAAAYEMALIRSCWIYVGVAASRECRKAGLPYLAYPEGSLDPWTLRYSRFKKRLWWRLRERSYFQGAAAIIALTRAEREHIRNMGLTNRIEVIPNGINLSDLEVALPRQEIEAQWGELKGKRWLLFLGRLHPKKGLDLLLPAFAQIAREFPDHVLVIAGPDEGGYAKSVEKMVADLNLAERVLLTGPVYGPTKIGLLKLAKVFVLTSYSEGQPMAVLEALGCGTPALLTEPCNVPEVAEAGAGLVVPLSVEAISRSLEEILRDEGARREMGRNGCTLVTSRFTWDKVARQTIALCKDIVISKQRY